MSAGPIDADERLHRAIAVVDGAQVTVVVEGSRAHVSQMRVTATQSGIPVGEPARRVFERITQDLDPADALGVDLYDG